MTRQIGGIYEDRSFADQDSPEYRRSYPFPGRPEEGDEGPGRACLRTGRLPGGHQSTLPAAAAPGVRPLAVQRRPYLHDRVIGRNA